MKNSINNLSIAFIVKPMLGVMVNLVPFPFSVAWDMNPAVMPLR